MGGVTRRLVLLVRVGRRGRCPSLPAIATLCRLLSVVVLSGCKLALGSWWRELLVWLTRRRVVAWHLLPGVKALGARSTGGCVCGNRGIWP
jgi:hypothetical protein